VSKSEKGEVALIRGIGEWGKWVIRTSSSMWDLFMKQELTYVCPPVYD
jgi:hypothetical protein